MVVAAHARSFVSASGLLGGHAHYLHWGVIQISLANFLIIVFMVVLFLAALLVPFPHSRSQLQPGERTDDEDGA